MRILTACVFALSFFLYAPGDLSAQDTPARTISVSGEGVFRVEPDVAVVRFGIVTRADDPESARRQNAEASSQTMNAVRDLGIEERRLRMETLRLQPRREYNRDTRRWEERGFEAVREVVVTVTDLELLPELVTRVVQRGANRLQQVAYELEDRDFARNEALREAVENARAKATVMTGALGVQLGRVQSISEQQFTFPRPVYQAAMEMAASRADAAEPEPDAFAAGEIEVRATVQIVFELD
ncbi:MAG: SIMPL domain-containing protein [Bacteroidota bacterium]